MGLSQLSHSMNKGVDPFRIYPFVMQIIFILSSIRAERRFARERFCERCPNGALTISL